jgi:hypothetical protein
MMKNSRKIVTLVLLLVLPVSVMFIACNQQNGAASESRITPVTLLLLGDKPTNSRLTNALVELNKLIQAKGVNAELRVQFIEWADWQNQYQLTLASGTSDIDLVVTATDWLFAWEIVRKGGFAALSTELLQKNAPATWAAIPASHWDACTLEGQIWFIPEDQYSQYTNHGMMWRGDWGAEGGVTQVTNFTQLEAYFDAVKKNHPEAYPWDISASLTDKGGLMNGYFFSNSTDQRIIGTSTGNFDIFFYDTKDPYTVVSPYMDGQMFIDAAQMFDRWSKKGFWREDVLNYTGDTRELMFAGLSGADQHHTSTYIGSVKERMDKEQPGSDLKFFYWGQGNRNVNRDLITHGAMAVNAASKNAALALQVYDLLRNDQQIYLLYNYGIEGVDYVVNASGTWERPAGYSDSTDSIGSNFWAGRMDAFEPLWDTQWSGRTAYIADLNNIAQIYPLEKFSFDNTKVAAEIAAIGDVCSSYVTNIQFGKTVDPARAVADFRTALTNAGYDKVKAEIQAQLTAFKVANGK